MELPIDDIIKRYNTKIGELTQQLVLAEAQRDAYKAKIEEQLPGPLPRDDSPSGRGE